MEWLKEILSRVFRNGVPKVVCDEIQKRHAQSHAHLASCIETASQRSGERFVELKNDMQREFDEVKKLL